MCSETWRALRICATGAVLLLTACTAVDETDLPGGDGDDSTDVATSPEVTPPASEPPDLTPSPNDSTPGATPGGEDTPTTPVTDLDGDGYSPPDDCNDADATIHPGAAELCDAIDQDCDGVATSDLVPTYYADLDEDGYGDSAAAVQQCEPPEGYVSNSSDCDDSDATIHPKAVELCDGIDQDCDGELDEGSQLSFYPDGDGDGYGDSAGEPAYACTSPQGYTAVIGDCDDTDDSVHPALVDPDSADGEAQGVFASIQAAVDSSQNCDMVQVMPGTYAEAVVLGAAHSGLTLESLEGSEQTSIEIGGGQRPLAATGIDDWVLDGFTLIATEAVPADGAALYVNDAHNVVLENLRVLDSHTSDAFVGGGIAIVDSDAITLSTSYLNGNSGESGGALAIQSSTVAVSDTVFQQNTSREDGGAIAAMVLETPTYATWLRLDRSEFVSNEAAEAGGAVAMAPDGELEVYDSYFYDNASLNLWGGAVHNPTHVERCVFMANSAVDGGISAGYGGAVMMIKSGDIVNSIFIQNSAVYAGAIEIWDKSDEGDSTFNIVNNTFVDNEAVGGFGHAVNLFSGDTILFRNNVVYGVGVEDGTTVFSWEGTPEWTVDHNDFFVDGGTILGGSGISNDDLMQNGNMQADPKFVFYNPADPTSTDCHLSSGSPCINSGNTGVGTDPDGTFPDMGAYGGPTATW